ncbi:MAG: hypothetical protein IPM77_13490 [Crocinitomicaceae bacterium]|nr:hypothetical protein [Crocinitomicaceae bacterium]
MDFTGKYSASNTKMGGATDHGQYQDGYSYTTHCLDFEIVFNDNRIIVNYLIDPEYKKFSGSMAAELIQEIPDENAVIIHLQSSIYFPNLVWNHDNWETHQRFKLNLKTRKIEYAY